METPVLFGSPRLFGILCDPPAPPGPSRPAPVLFLPGWSGLRSGPHRLFTDLARDFAARGIPSLRMDFRGRGESEGEAEKTTLDDLIEDALQGIGLLEQRELGAPRLCGICSGANTALGAASLRRDLPGLILLSLPLFGPQKTLRYRIRVAAAVWGELARKALRPGAWIRVVKGQAGFSGARAYAASVLRDADEEGGLKNSARDIPAALEGFRGRTLLIRGEKDREAALSAPFYRDLFARLRIPAEGRVIPAAHHNFYSREARRSLHEIVAAWLGNSENFSFPA